MGRNRGFTPPNALNRTEPAAVQKASSANRTLGESVISSHLSISRPSKVIVINQKLRKKSRRDRVKRFYVLVPATAGCKCMDSQCSFPILEVMPSDFPATDTKSK